MSSFNNPNHGSDLPGGSSGGQSGLDATRQQVDEVVDIMRNNVEKGDLVYIPIIYEVS